MVIKHTNTKRVAQSSRLATEVAARVEDESRELESPVNETRGEYQEDMSERGQPTMQEILGMLHRFEKSEVRPTL